MAEGGSQDEAGKVQAAPGALDLVRGFVNTIDIEAGEEHLQTAASLQRWLADRGLLPSDEPVDEMALRRALEIREALRNLMLANNGGALAPHALDTLNRTSESAHMTLQFDQDGQCHVQPTAGGVDGALGRLLAIVSGAMTDGTWVRLKACRNHGCWWAFYDRSKNRSATWCTMEVCGNRIKARAYRQRRRESDPVA